VERILKTSWNAVLHSCWPYCTYEMNLLGHVQLKMTSITENQTCLIFHKGKHSMHYLQIYFVYIYMHMHMHSHCIHTFLNQLYILQLWTFHMLNRSSDLFSYMVLNEMYYVNVELRIMRQEVNMVYFKLLSQHLLTTLECCTGSTYC
jgi:hypothetical protein